MKGPLPILQRRCLGVLALFIVVAVILNPIQLSLPEYRKSVTLTHARMFCRNSLFYFQRINHKNIVFIFFLFIPKGSTLSLLLVVYGVSAFLFMAVHFAWVRFTLHYLKIQMQLLNTILHVCKFKVRRCRRLSQSVYSLETLLI